MAIRFVLIWTALAALGQASIYGLTLGAVRSAAYSSAELMYLGAYLLVPAAEWVALRIAGVAWRTEWFVASVAGAATTTALFDLMRSASLARVPFSSPLVYMLVSYSAVAVFQWCVLRRHVHRHPMWFVAVTAAVGVTFGLRWVLHGTILPNLLPAGGYRIAIAVAAAIVEGAFLAWLLSSPRERSLPALRSTRTWTVVEWAKASGMALLVVIAATRLVGALLTSRQGTDFFVLSFVLPAIAGLVVGTTQWLLLRDRLPITRFWIVLSAAALTVPVLGIFVPGLQIYAWYFTVLAARITGAFTMIGAWLGLVQWVVLRHHVARSFVWVPATALAFSAGHLHLMSSYISSVTIGVLAGTVLGTVVALLPARRQPALSST
jgi:hypothetical protein